MVVNLLLVVAVFITVLDVNQSTLNLFKVKNKQSLLFSLRETFNDISRLVFIDYLVSIFNGEELFDSETQYNDLDGNLLDAILTISNTGNNDLRKNSIISITNITTRVQAWKKLLASLDQKNKVDT